MARPPRKKVPFPSREEIVRFIEQSSSHVGKRELARAFGLDADQKTGLRALLKELESDGTLRRDRGRRFGGGDVLPEVAVLTCTTVTEDGVLMARPDIRDGGAGNPPPQIEMAPGRHGQPALGPGDKVLARLERRSRGYRAKPIRKLSPGPSAILGVYRKAAGNPATGGGRIEPTDKRVKSDLAVHPADSMDAKSGELVRAEITPGRRLGLKQAKVVERLGSTNNPRAVSLISMLEQDIPLDFPNAAAAQAEKAGPAPLGGRTDLRDIPLVTIDGADARDFDDAVFAEPDDDPENPGGWRLIVAIADVAHYVRPGDALDKEACKRGNSVYFPDRVAPMLPEALSNGWCSLRPREERPCMACRMWIDSAGGLRRHRFVRGLMKSAARLTYEQVQAAIDGQPDDMTETLAEPVLKPLYGAYNALLKHRVSRQTLDLDLAERQVVVDGDGQVAGIRMRERLDSHKLVEEFMVTANVAAAEALEAKKMPAMYRIHDQPSAEKIESLSDFLATLGIAFNKGQVTSPRQFNGILTQVAGTPHAAMVNQMILRSQSQAEYNSDNIGHFGLALRRYCHFTSPIRRYSDLLVHRALISGYDLGAGGLPKDPQNFLELGRHISQTERRAQVAERNAIDRFTASFLADREGTAFAGTITGVTRFGLFITLDETGADGLIPIRSLPEDYYDHDERRQRLIGSRRGWIFTLGDAVDVILMEARPLAGGLIFQLLEGDDGQPGNSRRTGRRTAKGRPKTGKLPAKGKKSRASRRRERRGR